jgi:hypothetical protein
MPNQGQLLIFTCEGVRVNDSCVNIRPELMTSKQGRQFSLEGGMNQSELFRPAVFWPVLRVHESVATAISSGMALGEWTLSLVAADVACMRSLPGCMGKIAHDSFAGRPVGLA